MGSLDLHRCYELTDLPANLSVGSNLSVTACYSLTSLKPKIRVGGNLDLDDCTRLTSLSADLYVEGDLNLANCSSLTSLPDTILSWGPRADGSPRNIDVSGTGLSQSVRDLLHLQANQHLGSISNDVFGSKPRGGFGTLHEALAHFHELHRVEALLAWPVGQRAVLCQYLGRFLQTADYKNIEVRPAVLERLNAVLALARTNSGFRAIALDVLDDAV